MERNIKVVWKKDGHKIVGRIVEDDAKRHKIVFVDDRNFRGRMPKEGETTDAEVSRDTQPDNPGKGALIVRPVYAVAQNALTREQAEAELLKLARATGPVFGDCLLKVDLPGWKGELEGARPTRHEDGPLTVTWSFRNEENGRRMSVHEPGNFYGVTLTRGIQVRRGERRIVDWQQTVHDLGEPATVEVMSSMAYVSWKDKRGFVLKLNVPRDLVVGLGYTIEDVEDTPGGYVVASKIKLLGGRWVEEEFLGKGELMTDSGVIKPARLEEGWWTLTPQVKEQVVAILRRHLHSPDWHKQDNIRILLSDEKKRNGTSLWDEIHALEQALTDQSTKNDRLKNMLWYVHDKRSRIDKILALQPRFEKLGDPAIYSGVDINDTAEVGRLTAENQANLECVDRKIADLKAAVSERTK